MEDSHKEHFAHLLTLLKQERQEDRKQYETKIRNRSLQDRIKEGVCWYPVIINRSFLGTGERWRLNLEKTNLGQQKHLFQPGASVSVFLSDDKAKLSATGILAKVGEKTMTVVLNRDDPPDWIHDGKLGVNLLFDESSYDEMERAMKILINTDGKEPVMPLVPILLGESEPAQVKTDYIKSLFLNESQSRAVNSIYESDRLALVHGPPGTGKTTTLVQGIKEVLKKEKQVLVTATSNAAVDLVVEKLHQEGISVLRMGHPARVVEEVVSHTLDVQLTQHPDSKMLKDLRKKSEEMRSLGFKYKRKFGHHERQQRRLLLDEASKLKDDALMLEDHMIHQIMTDSQVIACTMVGATNQYLRSKRFKTVFIDEASQALEPATWIPVMKADKVVMAGDHFQLPPTIKSIEAGKNGLSETIFERCMKKYSVGVMLNEQYRMHPSICSFSNAHFYNNELKTSESVRGRRQLFTESLTFIDTAGCGYSEEINEETLSTFNKEEAVFVLDRLKDLTSENSDDLLKSKIGIIAPYKAQVEVLKKDLAEIEIDEAIKSNISVNTVDAFQGQERDVMIISLVRSNSRGEVGFLADQRRMNVAMTRAKFKMLIIGDSSTLSSNPFYDKMIKFFQEKGYYHSAFEYLY